MSVRLPEVAERYSVRRSVATVLLGTRGLFRLLVVGAPIVLAPVWGPRDFGLTVAAIGTFTWVVLLGTGCEKALLKLLPRHPSLDRIITSTLIAVVVAPVALALVLATAGLLVAPHHRLTLLALGLSWSACLGLLQVAAGLLRVRGRQLADAAVFATVAAAIAAATVAGVLLSLAPTTWLVLVVLGALVPAVGGLLVGWRTAPPRRGHGSRRVRRLTVRAASLLSSTEVLSQLLVAAAFVALQVAGDTVASGRFYVAIAAAGVVAAVLLYLLRLTQPRLSLRYRNAGAQAGRLAARQVADRGLAAAAAGAVLVAAVAAAAPPWVVLVALTVLEVVTLAARVVAVNHLENTDGRALTTAVTACALGLLLCAVALPLVASHGAAGAMALVVAGHVGTLVALRLLLKEGRGSRGTSTSTPV